jgi:hypothetical protein
MTSRNLLFSAATVTILPACAGYRCQSVRYLLGGWALMCRVGGQAASRRMASAVSAD